MLIICGKQEHDYKIITKEGFDEIDNYHDQIKDSKRQHSVCEIIIQVGSRENPVDHDTGKEIKHIHEREIEYER